MATTHRRDGSTLLDSDSETNLEIVANSAHELLILRDSFVEECHHRRDFEKALLETTQVLSNNGGIRAEEQDCIQGLRSSQSHSGFGTFDTVDRR